MRRILRRFLRRFLVRRFFFDVLALEKNRYSKVTQKMRRKSAEKSCGVHLALFGGGGPFHLRILAQTARHTLSIAARPRTQGEHVRVHHDIFGLKGMLAFAPRFFENKNQRKIRSANHLPLGLPYSCLRTAGSAPRGQNRHHINGVFKRGGALLAPEPSKSSERPDYLHNYRYKLEVGNGNP